MVEKALEKAKRFILSATISMAKRELIHTITTLPREVSFTEVATHQIFKDGAGLVFHS